MVDWKPKAFKMVLTAFHKWRKIRKGFIPYLYMNL